MGEAVERGNTSDRFDHPPLPISKLIDNNLSWILVLVVSWVDVHGLSTWQSLKSSQSRQFGHCARHVFLIGWRYSLALSEPIEYKGRETVDFHSASSGRSFV